MFNPQFFATDGPFDQSYRTFVEWAKVASPVVQVRLTDGRDFWANRIITSADNPHSATFFQEVGPKYRVAFIVPYERIAYIVLHSDTPPEYRRIPVKKRPEIGFRVEREQSERRHGR